MERLETPGEVLRRAREARGMTIGELSTITRITPRLLTSLENDAYEDFPAEVFVRGFLKNCARELELDPDELVELYCAEAGVSATPAGEIDEGPDPDEPIEAIFRESRMPRASYLIAILAILLGLGLAILIFGSSEPERLSDGPTHVEDGSVP